MLFEYKEKLPSKLVADLGKLIKQLYNAFNRYDTRKEQLAAIKHGVITADAVIKVIDW